MSDGKLFFGGIPTNGDIKKIREAFPDSTLHDGRIIRFEEIEEIILCDRKSNRFKGVTMRWRKMVENETGFVVVGSERGIGFKILPPPAKVQLSFDCLKSARRKARRGYVVTTRVKVSDLSNEDRQRLTLSQKANAAIISMEQIKFGGELPALV